MTKNENLSQSIKEMLQNKGKNTTKKYSRIDDFVKEVMPDYWRQKQLYKHHFDWFDFIMDKKNSHSLIMVPRGHGKSEFLTYILPLYIIYHNHNVRILLVRESGPIADSAVIRIKKQLERNERMKIKKDYPWANDKFIIQRSDASIGEPTLQGVGYETAITGGHFDWIFFDDIESTTNTKTLSNIKNHIRIFNSTFIPLDDNSSGDRKFVMIGTKKHPFDIYYHIDSAGSWATLIEPAITLNGKAAVPPHEYIRDETGRVTSVHITCSDEELAKYKVLWPEHRDIQYLLDQKIKMIGEGGGTRDWLMEYQQIAPNPGASPFDEDWLAHCYYTNDELPPMEEMTIFQSIDLAAAERNGSSYTVISTLGIHTVDGIQRAVYLLDYYHKKIDPWRATKIMVEKFNQWHPYKIWVEGNAFQRIIESYLKEVSMLPIYKTFTLTGKTDRMIMLAPYFELGNIKIKKNMIELLQEYRTFDPDRRKNDADILDTIEFIFRHEIKGYAVVSMPDDEDVMTILPGDNPGFISTHIPEYVNNNRSCPSRLY